MILSGTDFRQFAALFFAVLGTLFSSHAASITVTWDPSPDDVGGYRLYWVDASTKVSNSVDVGNSSSATLDSLDESKTYQFYVTAYVAIFNGLGFEQVESDPSNQVSYYIQGSGGPYALQFGGFSGASLQRSPRGTMGLLGEMYDAGTVVTLAATPAAGYVCKGWMINSVFSANNPVTVTMNNNTMAAPVIQNANGSTIQNPPPTEISLQMTLVGKSPTLSVGGELGAWSLEGTTNLATWNEVATGITCDVLTAPLTARYAFYRVRPVTLQPFNAP